MEWLILAAVVLLAGQKARSPNGSRNGTVRIGSRDWTVDEATRVAGTLRGLRGGQMISHARIDRKVAFRNAPRVPFG